MAFAKVLGGIILVLVVIVVVSYVVRKGLGHIIQPPLPPDKARFIKYMSCVEVMCTGNARDGDICKSPEVIEIELEREDGKLKSCHSVCEEIKNRTGVGTRERYCGKYSYVEFTFKEDVNLVANASLGTYLLGRGIWSTDISRIGRWMDKGYINEICVYCASTGGYLDWLRAFLKEGMILSGDDCAYYDWLKADIAPAVFVPSSFGKDNCIPWEGRPSPLCTWWSSCNFNKGTKIWMWSENNARHGSYQADLYFCGWANPVHNCPHVILSLLEPGFVSPPGCKCKPEESGCMNKDCTGCEVCDTGVCNDGEWKEGADCCFAGECPGHVCVGTMCRFNRFCDNNLCNWHGTDNDCGATEEECEKNCFATGCKFLP